MDRGGGSRATLDEWLAIRTVGMRASPSHSGQRLMTVQSSTNEEMAIITVRLSPRTINRQTRMHTRVHHHGYGDRQPRNN